MAVVLLSCKLHLKHLKSFPNVTLQDEINLPWVPRFARVTQCRFNLAVSRVRLNLQGLLKLDVKKCNN